MPAFLKKMKGQGSKEKENVFCLWRCRLKKKNRTKYIKQKLKQHIHFLSI